MTSSSRALRAEPSTTTGIAHQCAPGGAGTTLRFSPSHTAAAYRASPAVPTSAASTTPWARSRPGRVASKPMSAARSPARCSKWNTSRTGTRSNAIGRSCQIRLTSRNSPTVAPRIGVSRLLMTEYTADCSSDSPSTSQTSLRSTARGGRAGTAGGRAAAGGMAGVSPAPVVIGPFWPRTATTGPGSDPFDRVGYRCRVNRDFLQALRERVVIFDGAMGTMLQAAALTLDDYRGLEGCSEILCETRPDVIRGVHAAYFEAGADAVETNSFGSSAVVLG